MAGFMCKILLEKLNQMYKTKLLWAWKNEWMCEWFLLYGHVRKKLLYQIMVAGCFILKLLLRVILWQDMISYGLISTLLQTVYIELASTFWKYKIPSEHVNQILHICFDALLRFKAYDDKYTDSKSACLHSWQ